MIGIHAARARKVPHQHVQNKSCAAAEEIKEDFEIDRGPAGTGSQLNDSRAMADHRPEHVREHDAE